jgi:hypothetical protein
MDVARNMAVVGVMGVGLLAQAVPVPVPAAKADAAPVARAVARALPCPGLARYELAAERAGEDPVKRFAQVVQKTLVDDALARGGRGKATVRAVQSSRGAMLVVQGTGEDLDLTQNALAALDAEQPVHARLAASVLVVPSRLLAAHGLTATTTHLDGAATTRLLRAAVKEGGELHNLPEVRVAPLTPFTVVGAKRDADPIARDARAAVPPTAARPPLEVAGEMVVLDADRVAVAFTMVHRLPRTPELQAPTRELRPARCLRAGDVAVALRVDGDVATILLVRCTELAAAPLVR